MDFVYGRIEVNSSQNPEHGGEAESIRGLGPLVFHDNFLITAPRWLRNWFLSGYACICWSKTLRRILTVLARTHASNINLGLWLVMVICLFVTSALANPDATAIMSFQQGQPGGPNQPPARLPRMTICTTFGLVYALFLCLSEAFGEVVTAAMGMTSVIWVMMRNSPEVQPEYCWMMFAVWLLLFLKYMASEAQRVERPKWYIFGTLVFAWICMCITPAVRS
ncbi:hypothetical protein EK21DRAFT_113733 [Setomelanomma holmii]|uniref:Uncharacterized protein n=1 Tax=Setomelanomma holmii TaxID=210430 RepID=A0A9P4H8G8_9PLEO|nr:hypothetical protein EK21DRAFT_113733 [Setomelanomma holmii]